MAYGEFVTSVGETVGIARQHRTSGTLLTARFGTVTKINGHGHIFVQSNDREFVFNKRGDAYKDSYGPSLMQAAKLQMIHAAEEKRKTVNTVARELEQKVKEGWGYSGTFHATTELVDELEALVAKLKENVK
jgi:hypothetical protein